MNIITNEEKKRIISVGISQGISGGILTNLSKKYGWNQIEKGLLSIQKQPGKILNAGAWLTWYLKNNQATISKAEIQQIKTEFLEQFDLKKTTMQEAHKTPKKYEPIQVNVNEIFLAIRATDNRQKQIELLRKLPENYQKIIINGDMING